MQTLAELRKGTYKGTVSLKLSEELTDFPREIFELADTLEMLDLSRNKLSSLPEDFGRLKKLKILFAYDNEFTVLPEVLGDCPLLDIAGFRSNKIEHIPDRAINPNLRWFILTNNRITNLPSAIGKCPRMQKLMLAGNQLTSLPIELSKCTNLQLFRISVNQFSKLPEWLLRMPRLAWLAISANPVSVSPSIPSLQSIDWNNLEIKHLLGEGASGIISKAILKNETGSKEVAVKIFKGTLTSDGLPEDEMKACVAAGDHYGLVKQIGQITNHPDGKTGLVMELIPERFYNLGITPSLDSCTRDVYKEGQTLSTTQVVKIAQTIASVAAQLHSKGMMHSDLYAHNTLIDDEGNTLFGDFGAGCFYDKNDTATAPLLERLEVRAYGYLLDDLVGIAADKEDASVKHIVLLRDACLNEEVAARPGFDEVVERLLNF